MSLSDARRMWKLASDRGAEGLHSHDARRMGITGNPSQRAKDIADHVAFWTLRESRNGRPGSRYWADGFQPHDAVPVRPNGDSESGGGDPPSSSPAAALSITPSPEQVAIREPVAIVRDFTDPEGCWREVPVSELDFDYEAAA